jgi:large subunit ribosomal protein L29
VKSQEIQVLETDELADKLKSSRRELYELRFKLAVGQLDDHRQIRRVRQDIARLLTFKRQRELGILQAGPEDEAVASAPAAAVAAKPAKAVKEEEEAVEAPAAEPEMEPESSEEQE